MAIATELNVTQTQDATAIANTIFGDGTTIVSATITGAADQSGIYTGGDATSPGTVPSDAGVIFSTGNIGDYTNSSGTTDTNTAANTTTNHGGAGDAQLDAIAGVQTFDAVVFEATFIADNDFLTMQFTFSSEEYLEFVNGNVNDAVGVWVNGDFTPLTPSGDTVSIDTVNNVINSNLYIDNPESTDLFNTEMDGFTVTLSFKAPVNAGEENTIKIGLADGGDGLFDSNLLIAAESAQTVALAFTDNFQVTQNDTAVIDVRDNDFDDAGLGLTVTQINGVDVVVGDSVTLNTGEIVTLNPDGTLTVQADNDLGTNAFTYQVTDGNGVTDIGYVHLETVSGPSLDGYVDGSAGDDVIEVGYVGDPNGDLVDAGDSLGVEGTSGDGDVIRAYGGDDIVNAGAGDDVIYGGTGADTIDGGAGADLLFGEADDDIITVGGGDTADGGAGDDVFIYDPTEPTPGTVTVIGGEAAEDLSDPTNGDQGDLLDLTAVTEDTTLVYSGDEAGGISGASTDVDFSEIEQVNLGSGDDTVTGSSAADNVDLGEGEDTITAGAGDDIIGLGQDVDGTPDGDADVVILEDAFGNDIVTDVDAPIDNGDGTFTGIDTLDVSNLTDADGNPVHVSDVTVTADLDGNAILSFPNGESITLGGIPAVDAMDPAYLNALGVPGDGIVSGTAGDDLIDASYTGDPEGDLVDNGDAILAGQTNNDDIIAAGAGDDTVLAGAGEDEVFGEAGDDTISGGDADDTLSGGAGSDTLSGDAGDDELIGGADDDLLIGGAGNDTQDGGAGDDIFALDDGFGTDTIIGGETAEDLSDPTNGDQGDLIDASDMTTDTVLDISSSEMGTLTSGGNTASFDEIEDVHLGSGDDAVTGSTGDDTVDLGEGEDTIDAGAGDDVIGLGQDPDGTSDGDADVITFSDGDGNDTILDFDGPTDNGDGTFTGIDTFNVGSLTDASGNPVNTDDVVVSDDGSGNALLTFPNGETVTLVGIAPDDVSTAPQLQAIGIPCFTPGTLITTADGPREVETLSPGDFVLTRDSGMQRIRWVGQRAINTHQLAATPSLHPIRIKAGALGLGLPQRDMIVSPQHKMMLSDVRAELLFGEAEVLVAALHLVGLPGVDRVREDEVTYIHVMFESHEIILAEGAWTESYQPGPHVLGHMEEAQREELMLIFPELRDNLSAMKAARMTLKAREATVLLHRAN